MIVYPTCPQHSNVLPLFKSGIPSSCPRSTAPNVASFAFSQQSSGSTRFSHVHGTNLPHLTADLLFNAVLSGFLAKIGVRISWSFLTTGVPRNQNTFFELILTLNHYSDIVSDIPSGVLYGIYILTFYLTFFLAFSLTSSLFGSRCSPFSSGARIFFKSRDSHLAGKKTIPSCSISNDYWVNNGY